MLKFKLTKGNNNTDVKTLEVTQSEKISSSTFELSDNNFDTVTENNDKCEYLFWVKNLYGIQADSHLNVISYVTVGDGESDDNTTYTSVDELVATSVSKEECTFTVSIDKERELDIDKVSIETKYNAIFYSNNRWQILSVDRSWIEEEKENYSEVSFVDIDSVAYGLNMYASNYSAFYYENDSWQQIDFADGTLEGCLKDGYVDFNSFHEYDTEKRKPIAMDENTLYYTRENYIIIDTSSTHYFSVPNVEYNIEFDPDGDKYLPKVTETYYRYIVKNIDYPVIYLSLNYYSGTTDTPSAIKIAKECHIEDNKRLVFNYDEFKRVFSEEEKAAETLDENTKPIYPILIGTEESEGTIVNCYEDSKVITTYNRLTEDEIGAVEEQLFPYGYEETEYEDFSDNTKVLLDIEEQESELGNIKFKRVNFVFNNDYSSYVITYDNAVNVVQIPISQQFENDLHHNDMLKTNFVDTAKANAINPIIDMEKDVYEPAIAVSKDEDKQINGDYVDCFKIIFNLHFRKHRDKTSNGVKQEWICDKDAFWNGNRIVEKGDKKIVDFNGRIYNFSNADFKKNKKDYFSYYGVEPTDENHDQDIEDPETKKKDTTYDADNSSYVEWREQRSSMTEYQSDPLSFLGFANDDVKYQKSKLKKSFLRLLFYDSENIGNQNLLHSATIFLDSGDLFAKYIKNINTEEEYKKGNDIYDKTEYENMSEEDQKTCIPNGEPMAVVGSSTIEDDTTTAYDYNGVRVNREPMRKKAIGEGDLGDDIDELERLRLSSQIVVTDKFSSKHSSEGFYFYTYKTNDNGVYPSDIYMRVEFNHAGYGRTIPFMMPYVRPNEITEGKYKEKHIKTFKEIADDWSELDVNDNFKEKDEEEIGYGSVKYIKYSHIKWKYRYDKDTQKHIYYLDPEIYGESVISKNNHGHNIILNLYEGKIK